MFRQKLLTIAVLSMGLMVSLSFRPASAAGYSNASLSGTCTWSSVIFETTSGGTMKPPAGPAGILALITFDGKGAFKMDYDVNIDGVFSRTKNVRGIYSVDATGNGHGTFSYVSPVTGKTVGIDFYISRMGDALDTTFATESSFIVTPRVGNGRCVFKE
jgi:hypothetical protein